MNDPTTPAIAAKDAARRIRAALATDGVEITHARALELVSAGAGARDWNTLSAALRRRPTPTPAAPSVTVPVLRIFDVDQARDFYLGYLGWHLDWEHRFEDHLPLYCQVSRGPHRLHLSEHHGDASPGAAVILEVGDVAGLHAELSARDYPYARPGLEEEEWGRVVTVHDPFRNRLDFLEPWPDDAGADTGGGSQSRPAHDSPIRAEVRVPVAPDVAFARFVDLGSWWDPAYTPDPGAFTGAAPLTAVGDDVVLLHGSWRYPIGRVTAWEPGARYAQSFTLAVDPDHPTTLTVTFAAEEGGTRVALEHGGWTAGNASRRAGFTDWPHLLQRYAEAMTG